MKAKLITIYLIAFAMFSCEKYSDSILNVTQPTKNQFESTDESALDVEDALARQMVIGKKLPNPYSVDNMMKALSSLQTKSVLGKIELNPTHHYVMFKPECHEHYRSLIMQDDLDLYSFPLDHEISSGWLVVNPDPAFSTNGYSHKWSYVPVERNLANIDCPYEILYDIISIEEDEIFTTKGNAITKDIFELIEQESHTMCGIDLKIVPKTKASTTPSGRITYYDSSYGREIGCAGMSVRAHRLTKQSYAHCNEAGYFTCDKEFTYKWTYTVYWGRTDFEIRDGVSSTQEITLVLTEQDGPLNLKFNDSNYPDHMFHCEILRAACKYFYGEIDGLNRPPFKSDLKDRIYIQAVKGNDTDNGWNGAFYSYTSLNSVPYIRIFSDNSSRRSASGIYWTTMHELAHASHWKQDISTFLSASSKVKESYATGIAWYLTKKAHPNHTRSYDSTYTGVVQDLVDDDGYMGHSTSITENVSGFSIKEIEDAVMGAETWNEWQNNMLYLYPYNPTITNVQPLFALW